MMQLIALAIMIVVIPVASLTLIIGAAFIELTRPGHPKPPRRPNPSLTRTAWRKQTGRP